MKTEEHDKLIGEGTDKSDSSAMNSKVEKKKPFWKRHFLSLFLLLLLAVSLIWGYATNRTTISTYEKQITEIETAHEDELKVLEGEHLKQLVSTLALAVRSEMIAENMNQVNQYFVQSLNNAKVERLILVNHITGKTILSTNKKDEGKILDKQELVNTKEPLTKVYDNSTYAATPIMGLNTQLGVLIMQVD
ncbi:hypothetical protein [Brumimicrobium oceani]|uniref:Uncharacterized protein n=1 Tax=Brumimicrobium oceani TaxID=2100725 RepID=A0A2U2XGK5_9FLAO|nr:hypothetical protein [Brumimicrobium oceani]PWH86924.1 hypothetical protein DIT68_01295 [Brumimicrobium oceani]